jgi:regulator of sigma E protease
MRYVLAIVALGLLVAFHEYGHLLLARAFRIKVHRFSIGFGPALLTFRRNQIDYTVGAIPLGGFVKIHGMNPHEEGLDPQDPESFMAKAAWKRMLVIFAGPFFNYLLAVAAIFVLYLAGTHVAVPSTIGGVAPGSEAARAGLRPGDTVLTVDGAPVPKWLDLVEKVNDSPGKTLLFAVGRPEGRVEIPVTPRADASGTGRIGVEQQFSFRKFSFAEAVPASFAHVHRLFTESLTLMARLVTGKKGVGMSSPLGIVQQASEAAATGWDPFIRMLVNISAALALFNLLPIPALDGGRLLFLIVETITGRPVSPKAETTAHTIGFFALIAVLLYAVVGDIGKMVKPGPEVPRPASGGGPAADGGTVLDAGTR